MSQNNNQILNIENQNRSRRQQKSGQYKNKIMQNQNYQGGNKKQNSIQYNNGWGQESIQNQKVQQIKQKHSCHITSARLQHSQSPMGSRQMYQYMSPHYKINSSFNFWQDLRANVITRNQWEYQGIQQSDQEVAFNFDQVKTRKSMSPNPSVKQTLFSNNNRQNTQSMQGFNQNQNKQYMARFLYSQVDLGSDTESVKSVGHSPATRYMKTKNIIYDQQQEQQAQANEIDINTKRKVDSRIKWFTSQINDLPGPKGEIIQNLKQDYKFDKDSEYKKNHQITKLKSNQLYGAYYQSNKYIDEQKPSRAYRTYIKQVKGEQAHIRNGKKMKYKNSQQLYGRTYQQMQ